MTTIAQRIEAALRDVTGQSVTPAQTQGGLTATAGLYTLTVYPVTTGGGVRHRVAATCSTPDSSGRHISAQREAGWTSVTAMRGLLREARERAERLAALSDRLTGEGWETPPTMRRQGTGLIVRHGDTTARITGTGEVDCSDPAAQLYIAAAYDETA